METYTPEHPSNPAEWLALDEGERLKRVLAYHRRERIPMANERLHAAIHVVVETQVALGETVVVDTLARLQREGLGRHDAIHAVGTVLVDRILEAMRTKAGGPQLAVSYLDSLKALTAENSAGDQPPPIRIDHFRTEHRDAFAALNRAWLVGHGILEAPDELQLEDPEGQILARGGEIFVALQGSEVVGTGAIIPHGPGVMELAKLAVDPQAQRQGIGRRIVEAALAYARRQGAERVILVSSSKLKAALRLYESLGFQHRPMPADQPYVTADVYMELDLADGKPVV